MSIKTMSVALIGASLLSSTPLVAAEISLLSGVFQTAETERNNDNKTGKTTLEVGGRFATDTVDRYNWMIEGLLRTTKYDAPKGSADPDDDNEFSIGIGRRHYFLNMSESIRPLFQMRVGLNNESSTKTSTTTTGTTTTFTTVEKESTSLYYAADAGFRFDVSPAFFYEIEVPIFQSSLYGVEKESSGEGTSKVENKTSTTDLYVRTYNPLTTARFSVGMRF